MHFRLPPLQPQLPWRTRRRASSRWRPPCIHPRGAAQSCGAHNLQSLPLRLCPTAHGQQKTGSQLPGSHCQRLVTELRLPGHLVCGGAGQLFSDRITRLLCRPPLRPAHLHTPQAQNVHRCPSADHHRLLQLCSKQLLFMHRQGQISPHWQRRTADLSHR